MPCSNAAKTRNQLKFAGVPKTPEPISAVSGPKFTILWGHVEDILLLNKFFPIVDTCLSCEDIARQSCSEPCAARFRPAAEIRTKATPCVEVWQTSNLRRLRLGEARKKGRQKEETTGLNYNCLPYSIG